MADYMNEQEQVDMIKNWWKRHGNRLLILVLIVVLGVAGYRYWQSYQKNEVAKNGDRYMSLVVSAQKKDAVNIQAKAQSLMKNAPKSVYSGLAALTLGGFNASQGKLDQAVSNFEWVLNNQKNADLTAMAQLRLARIYLAQNKPDNAIKALTPVSKGYIASFEMLMGDAYAVKKDTPKAASAYQAALKAANKLPIKPIIELKLHNLPEVHA